MSTNELLKQFEPTITNTLEYQRQLWQARFSLCGNYLIACSYDSSIQRWKIEQDKFQQVAPLLGHHGWTQCLGFSTTHQHIFTADSWGRLICWPYAENKPQPVWSLEQAHDGWIRSLAVSPDGKLLATAGNDREIRFWNTQNGELVNRLPKQTETVFSLCFTPNGKSLVIGDLKGTVQEWNISDKKVARTLNTEKLYQLNRIQDCGGIRLLTFDSSGKHLICAGQYEPQGGFAAGKPAVLIFDWQTLQLKQKMLVGDSKDGFTYDALFHPAGFVMGTSCAFPKKGKFWFWMPDQKAAFYISKKITNGRSISLHPDQRRLAIMVSDSANANGRPLKGGEYLGGQSKIHIMQFPQTATKKST